MVTLLARGGRVLARAGRRFLADDAMTRAAALTYTTLLSLVPFLAVFLALFAAFGVFFRTEARIESFLLSYLLPGAAEAAIEYITRFTRNTATVGAVGFLFLLLTALLLMNAVEAALRDIYRLPHGRSIRQRVLSYWIMLTVAPLFLGVSIYLSGAARRLTPLASAAGVSGAIYVWSYVAPLLVTWGVFTLAYLVLPATSVRLYAAAGGAIVAAVLWEAAKWAFDWYAQNYASFERLYGAVALVPIFLVWIDLTWMIVLYGAEVAYCAQHQEPRPAGAGAGRPAPAPGPLAARVFWVVARDFTASRHRPSALAIADELEVDPEAACDAAARLEASGLVASVPDPADADAPPGLLPSRPLASVTVADAVRAGEGETAGLRGADDGPVPSLLAAAGAQAAARLETASYAALVDAWLAERADASQEGVGSSGAPERPPVAEADGEGTVRMPPGSGGTGEERR